MSAATQLTLDGRDSRVRTVRMRWDGLGECWGAKCAGCGAWLSKWDFTEQDAANCGVHALSRDDGREHRCPE